MGSHSDLLPGGLTISSNDLKVLCGLEDLSKEVAHRQRLKHNSSPLIHKLSSKIHQRHIYTLNTQNKLLFRGGELIRTIVYVALYVCCITCSVWLSTSPGLPESARERCWARVQQHADGRSSHSGPLTLTFTFCSQVSHVLTHTAGVALTNYYQKSRQSLLSWWKCTLWWSQLILFHFQSCLLCCLFLLPGMHVYLALHVVCEEEGSHGAPPARKRHEFVDRSWTGFHIGRVLQDAYQWKITSDYKLVVIATSSI